MNVLVGPLAELEVGTARRVMVGDTPVAVVRSNDGVFAITDRCSHADVALSEGDVIDSTIECWLHGSLFDLATGQALCLPATEPVDTWSVSIDVDGNVFIAPKGEVA